MAEDSGQDKTIEASESKRRRLREQGDVFQSSNLTSAALMIGGVLGLQFCIPDIQDELVGVARQLWSLEDLGGSSGQRTFEIPGISVARVMATLLPFLVILFLLGIVVSRLQAGPVFSATPLQPRLDRMNPVSGLKQTLFSGKSWVDLLKNVVIIIVIGGVSWNVVRNEWSRIMATSTMPAGASALVSLEILGRVAAWIGAIAVGLGALDYLHEWFRYEKRIRMSHDDQKKEVKREEGDPFIKQRRKDVHKEIVEHKMYIAAEREGCMAVANPTHIICILKYTKQMKLMGRPPKLIAKGRGAVADKLRQIAQKKGFQTVRDVVVARALFELPLNSDVPRELYEAVLRVMEWASEAAHDQGRWMPWENPPGQDEPEA